MKKLGFLGFGRIGRIHASVISSTLAKSLEIAGISCNTEDDAQTAESMFPQVPRHSNPASLLADPAIDAVLVVTPTIYQVDYVRAALEKGKHVFVEKPVSLDVASLTGLHDFHKNHAPELQVHVGFNRRYRPAFSNIKDQLPQLEGIHQVRITSRDPALPKEEYLAKSGGIFKDMIIHDFDLSCFLSGSRAKEVHALGGVLIDDMFKRHNDFDTILVNMRMENGTLCNIDGSRRASYGHDMRAEVHGLRGKVFNLHESKTEAVVARKDGFVHDRLNDDMLVLNRVSLERQWKAFSENLVSGSVPVGLEDARNALLMAEAAHKSATEDKLITVEY